MYYRRFRLFMTKHWLKMALFLFLVLSIVLPILLLGMVESYTRFYILGFSSLSLFLSFVNSIIFVALLYWLHYGGGFAKLQKTKIDNQEVNVHFTDVIGLTEAKRESWEVVQLIKDRARLKKIGGKILKGVLMVGPPGCGKTLLAKAIATEAKIPFISVAGSEFVEIFVGVGASRVRKLFKMARQYSYAYGACIIFIDELDVIGRGRSWSFMGAGEETNSTQNQLLVEMDGLGERQENVIVIGATNAAEEILDKALLRPGRFDRKIYIDKPNLEEREKLFRYYFRKVKVDPEIDVARLARKAVDKSPAEIENIIKEAALIATRKKKDNISSKEISEAIERIDLGLAHRVTMTPRERTMVAFHETGHLMVLYLLHPTSEVFKASIISRGGALGVVHHQPREELHTSNRDELLANIKVSLAGYVAEKLRFGVTSNGVASDFRQAMGYAHNMVWRFGMAGDNFLGDFLTIPEHQLSENIKEQLNRQTQQIINQCRQEVEEFLKTEWSLVERFAQELLEKEELEYDEIDVIFAEFGKKKRGEPSSPAADNLLESN